MCKCDNCKHALNLTGAYSGNIYRDCELRMKEAENATMKELEELIKHPEKRVCRFEEGTPKDGITYDE